MCQSRARSGGKPLHHRWWDRPCAPSHPGDLSATSPCWLLPGSLPSCLAPLSPHGFPGCQDCPRDKQRGVGGCPQPGVTPSQPVTCSPTCSPLSPGMPGTPRAPGTDCPGGPLSPCKGHRLRVWLVALKTLCPPQCYECAAVPVPTPWGHLCRWEWGWSQPRPTMRRSPTLQAPIPWAGGHMGGHQRQSAGRDSDRAGTQLLMPPNPHPMQGQGHRWSGLTFWPCMPSGPRGPTFPGGPGGPGAPSLPRGPGPPIMPGAPCGTAEGEAGGVRDPSLRAGARGTL